MKFLAIFAVLALAFSITACDWEGSNIERFGHHLEGIWVSNEANNYIYSGTLKITFDRITITGFGGYQTPIFGNDANRPFRNFTKGTALRGHSEDGQRTDMNIRGHIFIWDIGMLQEGIPYTYWWAGAAFEQDRFLTFNFGGLNHTFRKIQP